MKQHANINKIALFSWSYKLVYVFQEYRTVHLVFGTNWELALQSPKTPYGIIKWKCSNHQRCCTSVQRRKASKIMIFLHKYLWTSKTSYSYINTQETGMLKATATIEHVFMISRVMLLIDDWYISPCNSLLVHQVFSRIAQVNRAFFSLHSHIWLSGQSMLVRHEPLDLLTLAKFGHPFYLVIYMVSRCGSRTEDLPVMYEYDYSLFPS